MLRLTGQSVCLKACQLIMNQLSNSTDCWTLHPLNAISKTGLPLLAWTDHYESKATSVSMECQIRVGRHNIPQLSYLCGLQTPGQMFNLLTPSLCSFKTIQYCSSRIWPQHQPSPKPYSTDVFFSEICYFPSCTVFIAAANEPPYSCQPPDRQ